MGYMVAEIEAQCGVVASVRRRIRVTFHVPAFVLLRPNRKDHVVSERICVYKAFYETTIQPDAFLLVNPYPYIMVVECGGEAHTFFPLVVMDSFFAEKIRDVIANATHDERVRH